MILSPGATIGILGAGQLGRMLAIAALKVGLRCHIYAPEAEAPAHDAASANTVAAYEDEAALARFAEAVDVITFEFENVPTACVEFLSARKPVRPVPASKTSIRIPSPFVLNRSGILTQANLFPSGAQAIGPK